MPEDSTQPQPTSNQRSINWKKILIVAVVGAVVVGLGVLIFLLLQPKPETTSTVTSKKAASSAKVSTPSSKKNEIEGWITYENDDFSYQINTPSTWFISDTYCKGEKRSNQVFIYDKPLSGDCGVEAVAELGAKIAIYVGPLHDKFPNIFPDCKETQDSIEIAGLTAIKYYSPEEPCTKPGFSTTKIFFNHKENGYQIELLNNDTKGNYDSIYDQILSTFKFLD